jgi:EAL domain-containing protein (putative c-di-GMP-specific phosphodiesterase class I)
MIEQLAIPEICSGFKLSASLGVAVLETGERFETALACAATACRAAKDRGRNQVALFTENDRSLLQRQDDLHLFRQIIGALEGQRLQLMAQPIVPLRDSARGTQYELLVRLIDSSGNALGPAKFLSAATRYQLLPKLDRGVLRCALAEIAPFAHALAEQRAICWINVAGPSVGQPDFADFVRTSIKSSSVPGCLIGFEFTEGAAIGNLDAARRFIERVRELGCSFALDDFGTGFSSLAYLKTLAVSAVKIDGAFIRDLLTDARSEALVAAVLEIARQLGLDTVAEFVESPETAERLRTLGVTFGQGYHFARPRLLLDVLTELAAARSSPILQLASASALTTTP